MSPCWKVPLVAFLLLQNGGYLIAFTLGERWARWRPASEWCRIPRTRPSTWGARSSEHWSGWPGGSRRARFRRRSSAAITAVCDRCAGTRVVRASAGHSANDACRCACRRHLPRSQCSPFAPGTVGSAAGLALWAVLPGSLASQLVTILASLRSALGQRQRAPLGATDPRARRDRRGHGMLSALSRPGRLARGGSRVLRFRLFDVIKPSRPTASSGCQGVSIMADVSGDVHANWLADMASWNL
jgi:hypothetical protein